MRIPPPNSSTSSNAAYVWDIDRIVEGSKRREGRFTVFQTYNCYICGGKRLSNGIGDAWKEMLQIEELIFSESEIIGKIGREVALEWRSIRQPFLQIGRE